MAHPDYSYQPWSEERRRAASERVRARLDQTRPLTRTHAKKVSDGVKAAWVRRKAVAAAPVAYQDGWKAGFQAALDELMRIHLESQRNRAVVVNHYDPGPLSRREAKLMANLREFQEIGSDYHVGWAGGGLKRLEGLGVVERVRRTDRHGWFYVIRDFAADPQT